MRYDYTYEIHRTVEAQRFRHRERDLSHLRALKSYGQSGGIVSRIVGVLARLQPADSSRRREISYQAQRPTDRVCHLADGSMGRIAILEADGELIEVCVPA